MDFLSRGGEIKSLSSRQFGNPLMYCGVSIHATWTMSFEGLHEEQEQTWLRGIVSFEGPV